MSQNGRLKKSELEPIAGGGQLEKQAARAWNALARMLKLEHGIDVQVTDSYRPLGKPGDLKAGRWSQYAAWERYQAGGNLAAHPGTSNHGAGRALDLPGATAAAVAKYGDPFGWNHAHTDAPREPWHHLWLANETNHALVARWSTSQPGQRIQPGDHGPGVLELKHRLAAWGAWPRAWRVDDRYAGRTNQAVRAFQKAHHLKPDGIVGPGTWRALNTRPPAPRRPLLKPRPAAPRPTPPLSKFADIYAGDAFEAIAYRQAGHSMVALKATEGRTYTDESFLPRVQQARAAGLCVFAYHFARPSNNEPEAEADHFAQVVLKAGVKDRDRLVLDWEDPKHDGAPGATTWIEKFARRLSTHGLTLRVLYAGGPYLEASGMTSMPTDHTGKPLRFWLAAYTANPETYAPAFTRQHLWAVQYTDRANVAGIGNPCDYNYIKGVNK